MFVASSITPVSDNNPSFRIYEYDNATGLISDYSTYFVDLYQANLQGQAKWTLEYEFDASYGV